MQTATRAHAPATPAAVPERRIVAALFVLSASAFLLLGSGAITVSDGRVNYETTRSLVEHGTLAVDPAIGVPGKDGAVSRYGLGLPLVSIPAYVLAKPFAGLAADPDLVTQAAVAMTVPLIAALLVVAMYLLGRRLGAGPRAAVLASLGAVVGTFLFPYTKTFFTEPLAALGIVLAIERLLAGKTRAAGWAFALGVITRPQTLAILPLLAFVAWRRRALPPLVPGVAASIAVLLAHNLWRFGSVARFGYADADGFTTPLLEGAAGLLLHPGKSVVLFAPVVVLAVVALRRAHSDAIVLIGGNAVITFVLGAMWWSWTGGWSWGPRLLIVGIAPLLPALAPWLERSAVRARAVVTLLVLGLVVSLPAMIVSPRAQQGEHTQIAPTIGRQYALVVPTVTRTARDLGARADGDAVDYVELWQVNAAAVLGPVGLAGAAAGSLVLVAAAALGARRLRRALA